MKVGSVEPYKFLALMFISTMSFSACVSMNEVGRTACNDIPSAVVIDTKREHMWLCQSGSAIKDFNIALGRGGADKHEKGDHETPPPGEYSLGEPRKSMAGFHTFIPIGYPTEEQKRQGKTGGDVGIHGPPESWKWLGRATTWVNWTDGCIAVGSDGEIVEIADWVRSNEVKRVMLR